MNENTKYYIASLIAVIGGSVASNKADAQHMGPEDDCIGIQFMQGGYSIPQNDTMYYPISGEWASPLHLLDENADVLEIWPVDANYERIPSQGGPASITINPGQMIQVIAKGNMGQYEDIVYADLDCDPEQDTMRITIAAPLPVTRLGTSAEKKNDGTVQVSWTVAQEVNNDKFEVERSTDLKAWKEIEEVAGRGNASEPKKYTIIDEKPAYGNNYYRVKQTDFDGNSSYSPVSSVAMNEVRSTITLYPNPTSDFVTVEGDAIESIVVYNELGHELNVKIDGNRVDLSGLPDGLLFIETIQPGNSVQMHRVVKSSK